MKKLPLVIMVIVVAGGLAGLDYWFNFFGQESILPPAQMVESQPLESIEANLPLQNPSPETDPVIPAEFTGIFPLLLETGGEAFPYRIAAQQRVFDLFGVFDLNRLPGVQVIRYDMMPLNSDSFLQPLQVYELKQVNQTPGITFLSLKTYLSNQADPVNELNAVEANYASNVLFYNPVIPSENAFLLSEHGMVLGFVYPKASTETFESIQNVLRGMPEKLLTLSQ